MIIKLNFLRFYLWPRFTVIPEITKNEQSNQPTKTPKYKK